MEILRQGRVVGELTGIYPGKLVDPGPELAEVTSRTYTICTGGSCLRGGAWWEPVGFEQLGLGDQIKELLNSGFDVKLSSGVVLQHRPVEPLSPPRLLLNWDPPLKPWTW